MFAKRPAGRDNCIPEMLWKSQPKSKHWHGAAKDSWVSHLALEVPAAGGSNEWLESVPDEEYNKLA